MNKKFLFDDEEDNFPEPPIEEILMRMFKITKTEWDQLMIQFKGEIPSVFSSQYEGFLFLEVWRENNNMLPQKSVTPSGKKSPTP